MPDPVRLAFPMHSNKDGVFKTTRNELIVECYGQRQSGIKRKPLI